MKRIITPILATLICLSALQAVTPEAFNFQFTLRDAGGNIIRNKVVSFRISILEGASTGISRYSETQLATTNTYGVASFAVGEGSPLSGSFASINWGSASYYIKVEADINAGTNFSDMGASRLLSVPYALHAKTAENATDADADPVNELISAVQLNGNILEITEAGLTRQVDLSPIADQPVSLAGSGSVVVTGSYPNFTIFANNTGGSQVEYTAGTGISIVNGTISNTGDLSNTNELQTLSISGNVLSLSNGNSVTLPQPELPQDLDNDSTNELQTIRLSNDTLYISQSNFVVIPAGTGKTYTAGTGISIENDVITNTAPNIPVNIVAGNGITVTGTYPDYTITNAASTPNPSQPVPIRFQGQIVYVHPSDNAPAAAWAPVNGVLSGATSLTDGRTNSQKIVTTHGGGAYAAKLCDDLVAFGFDDWYLPSRYELDAIKKQSYLIEGLNYESTSNYWSSTEYDGTPSTSTIRGYVAPVYNYGWKQTFDQGKQVQAFKVELNRVRCVRKN